MVRNGFVLIGCILVIFSGGIVHGQPTRLDSEGILNVQPSKVIYVKMDVRTSKRPLMLPSCGGNEPDGYSLCLGESFLEIKRGKNWERAKPPRGMLATLGVEDMSKSKWIKVETSSSVPFVFAFTPELLGIAKGDQLRITVDAWTDQSSPKLESSHLTFISPVFVCP